MQVGQFPASAATSLIDGYCDDFVSLATVLAQTLEQVSIRGIKIDQSRLSLERIERGMREMAEAIGELLQSGKVTHEFEVALGRQKKEPEPEPEPPMPAPAPAPAVRPQPPRPGPTASRAPAPPPAPPAAAPVPPRPAPRPTPPAAAGPARPPAAASRPPVASTPAQGPATPPPAAPRPTVPPANRSSLVRTRFEALERDRSSGTLYIQTPQELLAFEFVDGLITQTATDSTTLPERLGDLLVEAGSCKREQVIPVVAKLRSDESHLLGEVMVREGIVSNRQVVDALETQAHRRIHRACAAVDARIEFSPGEMMADDGRVRLSPTAVLRQPHKPAR